MFHSFHFHALRGREEGGRKGGREEGREGGTEGGRKKKRERQEKERKGKKSVHAPIACLVREFADFNFVLLFV